MVKGLTQSEINEFHDQVTIAVSDRIGREVPEIEVERKVLEHFNRGRMKGIDDVGYFIYQGVKCYEKGKMEDAQRKDGLTMEQVLHGGK